MGSPPQHDTAPAIITDHPFVPKGAWWTLCRHCNLAQSAHAEEAIASASTSNGHSKRPVPEPKDHT